MSFTEKVHHLNQQLDQLTTEAGCPTTAERGRYIEKDNTVISYETNQILNGLTDGVCVIDIDFNVVDYNKAFSNLSNINNADDLNGKKCHEICIFQLYQTPSCPLTQIINGKHTVESEIEKRQHDGKLYSYILAGSPLKDADGKLVGIIESVRDVTDLKQAKRQLKKQHFDIEKEVGKRISELEMANTQLRLELSERQFVEEALRESEKRFRNIAISMVVWIWEVDVNGVYTYCSERIQETLGYSAEEVIGKTIFDFMQPGEAVKVTKILRKKFDKAEVIKDLENWNLHKDGRRICLLTNGVPIVDEHGNLRGYRGVNNDITARKEAEATIRASLEEKEMLLKEIHHRVKNNLQVVSSLLDLQSEKITDNQALQSFQESQNRVKTMALIHEKLYQSEGLTNIDFAEYIQSLTNYLFRSYEVNVNTIRTKIITDNAFLNIDKGIPCGLIINELVSNSLKHAFPDGKEGEICIDFQSEKGMGCDHEPCSYTLVVSDNGIGLPDGVDIRKSRSLGMTLITTLVKQLRGKMDISNTSGTKFKITFSA